MKAIGEKMETQHHIGSKGYFIPNKNLGQIKLIEGVYYHPYSIWDGDKVLLPIIAVITVDGNYAGTRSNWGRDYPSLEEALEDGCIVG